MYAWKCEPNIKKHIENIFEKVSQSFNSRKIVVYKNLILLLIFGFFFTLEKNPAISKDVKLENQNDKLLS